ncbi:MAG TPA: RimK family protein, partial [Gemmatimonadota bacterium]|nr:RimK family protein [Gemmatimonadota bacterium]
HAALQGATVCTPDDYLEGKLDAAVSDRITVINLCRSYQYLARGYYVSLLADARRQRVLPTLRMIEEITNPYTYFMALRGAGVDTIEFRVVMGRRLLPKIIVPIPARDEGGTAHEKSLESAGSGQEPVRYRPREGEFVEVTSVFGRTLDPRFRKHCAGVFKVYPFPLLRIRVYRDEVRWKLGQIYPLSLGQVGREEMDLLNEELSDDRLAKARPREGGSLYRIAVLMDESDPFAPSDDGALARLKRVGEEHGVLFEEISRDDLPILAEYDSLFLRVVTGMDHYSFLFAQRAKSLGIPVIDDPQSTVRCSNKVYLHELFRKAGLPTPRTLTISRKSSLSEADSLGYPLIVKQPDGTFSAAVKRAADRDELQSLAREMFRRSPLLTLQEYRPTEFDWRVGVLDGGVLFVCKYYMARGHWQIVGESRSGKRQYGKVDAVAVSEAPESVRRLALEAAALIGDGLYGVDIKETETGPVLIEINDNPDLWIGEEDAAEGDRLYEQLVFAFLRRIQESVRVEVPE